MGLKEIRIQKKMTQKELADALGVKPSIISRFESGVLVPSVARIKELSKILNVPTADLMPPENQEVLVVMNNGSSYTLMLTEDEIAFLQKLKSLDETGKEVVYDVTDCQVQRCQKRVICEPTDSTREIPLPSKDISELYTVSDRKGDKYNNLRRLKQMSFLTYSNIQMLLAFRGYNHLLSVFDLMTIFNGIKEPSEKLYNDLIDILEYSTKM